MSNSHEKDLWKELAWRDFLVSILITIILTGIYLLIGSMPLMEGSIWYIARQFFQDIIANLIPVLFLFVVSYAFLRRIQTLRSERETEELASKISSRVADIIESKPGILREDALALREAAIKGFYPVDLVQERFIFLYGIYGAKGKYHNVTQRLNSRISGGRLEGIASNDYLLDGADPIRGVEKKLAVVYYHAGQIYITTKAENEGLSLPQR